MKHLEFESIEYRLLTSNVVKDLYCNPPHRESYTRIKNRIVSWRYSNTGEFYFICFIDEDGYPRWLY